MEESEILLETRDLVKTFDEMPAVNGLNLEVRAGEMVGLVGPDGAGKTTAMRLMVGALAPTSGQIRVAGYELPAQVEKAREHLGYLAQRFSLYGDLTVRENLDFFGEVFDIPEAELKQRSQDLLRFAGLEEFADRRAADLSGGMQKKLGLATALVHRPKVLLLDEPTGGVDPVARFKRVVFMNHGRALTQGAPRDLMDVLNGRVLELATDKSMAARAIAVEDPDVEDVHTFGEHLHLRVRSAQGPLARLPGRLQAAGVPIHHLKPVTPSLEDVFIQLLGMEEQPNVS
jgi:ABC-2 type transport system ATP-binding protein